MRGRLNILMNTAVEYVVTFGKLIRQLLVLVEVYNYARSKHIS